MAENVEVESDLEGGIILVNYNKEETPVKKDEVEEVEFIMQVESDGKEVHQEGGGNETETDDGDIGDGDGVNNSTDNEHSDDSGYGRGDTKFDLRDLSIQEQVMFLSRQVDSLQGGQSKRSQKYSKLQQLLSSETGRLQGQVDNLRTQVELSTQITDVIREQLGGALNRLTHLELLAVSREPDFVRLDDILCQIVEKILRMDVEGRLRNATLPPPAPVPFPVPVAAPFPAPVPVPFPAPVPVLVPAVQSAAEPNQSQSQRTRRISTIRTHCHWCRKNLSSLYIQKHMKSHCKAKPVPVVRILK